MKKFSISTGFLTFFLISNILCSPILNNYPFPLPTHSQQNYTLAIINDSTIPIEIIAAPTEDLMDLILIALEFNHVLIDIPQQDIILQPKSAYLLNSPFPQVRVLINGKIHTPIPPLLFPPTTAYLSQIFVTQIGQHLRIACGYANNDGHFWETQYTITP